MLELNFDPFPNLETERLLLQKITMDNTDDLFLMRTNKEVMKYIDRPIPNNLADIEVMINKMNEITERIQWGIWLKGNPKLIGTIGYHKIDKENYRAEIGYLLNNEYWNAGIMSEAITKVLDFGFNEMNLHSIEANINTNNEISKKIIKKFGFNKEAHFKENYFFEGKFLDSEIYSLVKN